MIDMSQILNDAIKEKKESDKIERERKKANKMRQMKMSLKNRKNGYDYINKKYEEKIKKIYAIIIVLILWVYLKIQKKTKK